MVGASLKNFIFYNGEKRVILLNHEEYVVYAIIEEDEMLSMDIYVHWDNLDKLHKDFMISGMKNVLQRRQENSYIIKLESLLQFTDEVNKLEIRMKSRMRQTDAGNQPGAYRAELASVVEWVCFVTCLFSSICCFAISKLWVYRRKREYYILRMFGFSMVKIAGRAWWESWKVSFAAFWMAFLLFAVQSRFVMRMSLSWQREGLSLLSAFGVSMLIQVIVVFLPFMEIMLTGFGRKNINRTLL